jgi:uncharacterized protein YkwD
MRMIYLFIMALLWIPACMAYSGSAPPAEKNSYSSILLNQINTYRLENRLNRLQIDPTLTELARQHSLEMFQAKQVSHKGFNQRVQLADSQLCVENVGWNYLLPQEMFAGWQQSKGHRRNMLKKGVQRVGIAEVNSYVTFFACK